MTNREQELLTLLRRNPSLSQNELALALGITRSSVAVHITNLTRKGYILGKGYILKQEDYICVIGGSNMDIIGFPNDRFIPADSNPGSVKTAFGGVGRNIAENLVRLSVPTKLISAVGEDIYGRKLLEHGESIGLDMKETLISNRKPTSTYLAILDEGRDMRAAISQMDILEELTADYIRQKKHVVENAKLCILDTNLPENVIYYLLTQFKDTEFFLDTVSSAKAMKVKDKIGMFHTIKPNKIEAELLSGIPIHREVDWIKASEYFLRQGVKQVYITMGSQGVFYNNGKENRFLPNPRVQVVNATGAGDAFLAALAYCRFHGESIDFSARFAMAAAFLALASVETINPECTVENVNKMMKETGLC